MAGQNWREYLDVYRKLNIIVYKLNIQSLIPINASWARVEANPCNSSYREWNISSACQAAYPGRRMHCEIDIASASSSYPRVNKISPKKLPQLHLMWGSFESKREWSRASSHRKCEANQSFGYLKRTLRPRPEADRNEAAKPSIHSIK